MANPLASLLLKQRIAINTTASRAETFKGNDSALFGIVLGVITFWLFAQTTLSISPDTAKSMNVSMEVMNIAIATFVGKKEA